MPKVIESPVKRWPGKITISDPLTFPQVQAIEDATGEDGELKKLRGSKLSARILPAVLACVEKWELDNFTPDPFPASPVISSSQLIVFVFNEIMEVYIGERDIPNESSPLPIDMQTAESEAQK
jgi:hypothetical protein